MRSKRNILYGVMGVLCHLGGAAVPLRWEADFARASLAYRERKFDEAIVVLGKMETALPGNRDVLELLALTLKTRGDLSQAKRVYSRLLAGTPKTSTSGKRGVYAFELGALAVQSQQHEDAKRYLEEAIQADFNVVPARFLLGQSHFLKGQWEVAKEQFVKVVQSDQEAFRAPAQLFLAQTEARLNRASDSVMAFVEARNLASSTTQNFNLSADTRELARRVFETSDKELRSYDRSQWFADVGFVSGYDTNVLSVPNTGDASSTSSPGSFKESLTWGLGYSTSPIKTLQAVSSYRGAVNYNFNEDTRSGQFFTHDLAVFLTRGALLPTQYGLKVAGSGILQYQTDAFKPYSLTGTVGPFVKTKIANDSLWFGAEAFFAPGKNYLDPTVTESQQRSGWEQTAKLYLAAVEPKRFWTPGFYLNGALMKPNGSEYQGQRAGFDFSNTMYLTDRTLLSQSVGFLASWYPERIAEDRQDQLANFGVSGGYLVTQAFTATAAVQYSRNFSSESSYRYDRWNGLLSANYRF